MNRKIISLLAALLVCLNLFPVRALAAEEMLSVGASHVIDTGTPPEELPELGACIYTAESGLVHAQQVERLDLILTT